MIKEDEEEMESVRYFDQDDCEPTPHNLVKYATETNSKQRPRIFETFGELYTPRGRPNIFERSVHESQTMDGFERFNYMLLEKEAKYQLELIYKNPQLTLLDTLKMEKFKRALWLFKGRLEHNFRLDLLRQVVNQYEKIDMVP